MDTRPQAPTLGRAAQSSKINWPSTIVFSLFHIGAVAALFFFTWKAFFLAIALYVVAINMGIGMGYHRLLTHRGYRTPKWVEYMLTVCACLALEGGPMFWVATHRVHHQITDKPGDPHTPHEGGWWAHIGWIMMGDALGHEAALSGALRSRPGQRTSFTAGSPSTTMFRSSSLQPCSMHSLGFRAFSGVSFCV